MGKLVVFGLFMVILLNLNDQAVGQTTPKKSNRPARFTKTGDSLDAVKEYMLSTFKGKNDEHHAEMIAFGDYAYVGNANGKDAGAMFFDLETALVIDKVKRAFFHFYFDKNLKTLSRDDFTLDLYKFSDGNSNANKKLLKTSTIDASRSRWYRNYYEITATMQDWMKDSSTNYGFLLQCRVRDQMYTLEQCGIVGLRSSNKNRPFLVAYIDTNDDYHFLDTLVKQTKGTGSRDTINGLIKKLKVDRKPKIDKSLCRKHDLTINFDAVGWKFVFAPQTLEIGYCSGTCKLPIGNGVLTSGNGVIHSFFHSINPKKYSLPCCSSGKFDKKQLLVSENKKIVLKDYNDLVVSKCACY